MPFHATVLYPNEDDTSFNMDYYLASHMPLVQKGFEQHGLQGWSVLEFKPDAQGNKPKYCVQATLVFDNPDDLQKALKSEDAGPIFGDIPNFCNKSPVFLGGDYKGSWGKA